MKVKLLALFIVIIICCGAFAARSYWITKKTYIIESSDIPLFWQAYDSLKQAHNNADSINIIQHVYLDNMSSYGKKYITMRNYTAAEYVKTLEKYPKYIIALRKKTADLSIYKSQIDTAYKRLNAIIPNFNYPDVCFEIGCFRGGGTKTKNKEALLIGCEIALADSAMDYSEFKGTLHGMFSHAEGNISDLIAHESVHCQQWNGQNNTLLSMALAEGGADFIAKLALKSNINKRINYYGMAHECELWHQFEPEMDKLDISAWFYNSSPTETRPADLGYFVGRRICEAYYNKQTDKKQAIINLLNRGKYLEVMQQSGYSGYCKN